MPDTFVHLHLHTEYSLVNGMIRIPHLIEQTLQNQMPAVAITDICNLYGAVKFYNKAMAQGIKPIIGADVYITNHDKITQPYSLVLLAQNDQGYKNLSVLISRSYREGTPQANRSCIEKEWLQGHTDGLIALSGGQQSELGAALMAGRDNLSQTILSEYQALFPNRFYIELQRVGRAHEEEYIRAAVQLAATHQVPLVATNDAHFMQESDFDAHEVRVCINEGRVLNDPRRVKHHTPQQRYKTTEEMVELFADIPSAIENTVLIAQRCNLTLRMGEYFLPDYPVPEGETIESHLSNESYAGLDTILQTRFQGDSTQYDLEEYQQRMKFELDIINQMGFPGYFLIVADFIRWAKNNDVPVGPGRGSGAGSIVAYALGITDLDPIEHILLFERFLNPERVSMPDFDIDFCIEGRERVIDYVAQKYGRDKVSQIITYGTMAAKGVVRDVGRVLGMSYGHVDKVAKLIPFDLGITLDKALEKEEELRQRYEQEEEITALIDMAKSLEGLARNVGKHAGGVVIAPTDLTDFTPLYCEQGSEQIVSQYDKDDLETIGLVKFDFLGLKTLTIIDRAVKSINQYRQQRTESPIDIGLLALDDKATYDLLKQGMTTAIFQLESSGMKELIKNLQPDQFDDIVALVALYRPGPLGAGMEKVYCDRKHGKIATEYPHPMLEPILDNTYGVILYQEQVMEIARVMAGYSLGGADILRRAMGKKKAEEMAKQRAIFMQGAGEREVPESTANEVFDLMEYFAEYGFNKSHSAAYALVSYHTAWLKTHYPAHFMASCMSSDMDQTDKVVILLNESEVMGLTVHHPDINRCDYYFVAPDEQNIIYGLGAIKGIGRPVIESIISAREQGGAFKDLFDLCARVDAKKVNRRALEALIRAGALDELGTHRASLIASIDLALDAANQQHRSSAAGQDDFFGVAAPTESMQSYQNVEPWKEEFLLSAEKDTLGLYLSGHPIDLYIEELNQFTSCRLVDVDVSPRQKKSVTLAGLVVDSRVMNTKSGNRMAFITLDDKSARIEIGVFSELYDQRRDVIHKDKVLVVKGTASHNHFSGGIRLSADELFDIEQARSNLAKFMRIQLQGEQLNAERIQQLKNVLKPDEQGQCGLGFQYKSAFGVCDLDMAQDWRVIPSKLMLEQLEALVGQSNIKIVY